jgi:N-acyl-D-aspartate/D-glutamate deacylase
MTGLPAQRFSLDGRGFIREGCSADLVLFDPNTIADTATFADPIKPAIGIEAVWVNGTLSYTAAGATGNRAGRFIARGKPGWVQ